MLPPISTPIPIAAASTGCPLSDQIDGVQLPEEASRSENDDRDEAQGERKETPERAPIPPESGTPLERKSGGGSAAASDFYQQRARGVKNRNRNSEGRVTGPATPCRSLSLSTAMSSGTKRHAHVPCDRARLDLANSSPRPEPGREIVAHGDQRHPAP
jgi:hypothetical protein